MSAAAPARKPNCALAILFACMAVRLGFAFLIFAAAAARALKLAWAEALLAGVGPKVGFGFGFAPGPVAPSLVCPVALRCLCALASLFAFFWAKVSEVPRRDEPNGRCVAPLSLPRIDDVASPLVPW